MNISEPGPRPDLPPYAVRCVDLDPVAQAAGHTHVVAVGTDDPDGGETRWTLVQVVAAMRDGEQFIMGGGKRRQTVALEPTVCPRCHVVTLSTDASDSEAYFSPCA